MEGETLKCVKCEADISLAHSAMTPRTRDPRRRICRHGQRIDMQRQRDVKCVESDEYRNPRTPQYRKDELWERHQVAVDEQRQIDMMAFEERATWYFCARDC